MAIKVRHALARRPPRKFAGRLNDRGIISGECTQCCPQNVLWKDEVKYATLLTEMQSFNAGSGGYKTKLETADAAVKLKVAHLL